ncbi:YfzA family protein [Paenibacillus sp. 2TAF8]|uniref:YfzA family protein n=1 Tax=Paenibacillus sp. 2TAF8 TaxID=3233020 RepID=UPI003F9DA917
MAYVSQKSHPNRTKRWMISIVIFVVLQVIFIVIDGTSLEPRVNDSDNVFAVTLRGILESKLFNEGVAPYSFPLFNLILIVYVAALFLQGIADIISVVIRKR